jgi:hypothetical protein
MKDFDDWKKEQAVDPDQIVPVTQEQFFKLALEYFNANLRGSMGTFFEHLHGGISEAVETSRYSIEVNYRTKKDEALEGFAKVALGYVSAALKNHNYHTKHVFSEKPLRLLVSTRNWDDGEWVGCVTWNHDHSCFVISKGFYNKDKKSITIQKSERCKGDNAAEVSRELVNLMHRLKDEPDRHMEKLKPVPLKRGPKS